MSDIEISVNSRDAAMIANLFGTKKLRSVIARGMKRGLRLVHEALPEYPPASRMNAVTKRSSRFRSAKIRGTGAYAGRRWIESYRRTGTLGKSITEKVEETSDGVKGVIGTNVSRQTASSGYAEYVIGDDSQQAWMHKGRWWQLPAEVEKHADDISGAIADEIETFLTSD